MGMKKIINSYIMKRKYEFIFFVVLFRFLSSVLSFLYVPIINYLEENLLYFIFYRISVSRTISSTKIFYKNVAEYKRSLY